MSNIPSNIPFCNQQILMDLKDNILFKTFLGKFHSHYFEDNEDCIYLNPIDKSQVSNLLSIYEIDVRDKDISEHNFLQSYRLGYLFKVNASLLNSFLKQDQDEDKNEIKDVYLITYSNLNKQPEYAADFKTELVKGINVPDFFQDTFEKMTKKQIIFDKDAFSSLDFLFEKDNKDFYSSPLIDENVQLFYIGDLRSLSSVNVSSFTRIASNLLIKNNINLLNNKQYDLFKILELNTIISTNIYQSFLEFVKKSISDDVLMKIEAVAQDLRKIYLF